MLFAEMSAAVETLAAISSAVFLCPDEKSSPTIHGPALGFLNQSLSNLAVSSSFNTD